MQCWDTASIKDQLLEEISSGSQWAFPLKTAGGRLSQTLQGKEESSRIEL